MGYNKAAGDQVPATEFNSFLASAGLYGASSAGSDTYAITVTPTPNDYDAGDKYTFRADVANTGAATLNVNGLGARTIKKSYNVDLQTGDIQAGQMVHVIYDAVNSTFQMVSVFGPVSRKIYITTTEVTFTNGNGGGGAGVETTLLSTTIPAGTLSTNEAVRFKCYFRDCNIKGAAANWVINVKYGGVTQLALSSIAAANDQVGMSGFLEGYLIADGSTSVQKLSAELLLLDTAAASGESDNDAAVQMDKQHTYANGAGSIASASDQTFVITLTQLSDAANDGVFEWGIVEKV